MTTKFYRAAQKGIEFMNAGSYYSFSKELAENYVYNNDVLYSFDKKLNLFDVTKLMDINDFDLSLNNIFEVLEDNDINVKEIIEKYDGVMLNCSDTWNSEYFILFGRLEVSTNNLTKLSFDDMINEDKEFENVK